MTCRDYLDASGTRYVHHQVRGMWTPKIYWRDGTLLVLYYKQFVTLYYWYQEYYWYQDYWNLWYPKS